MYFDMRDNEVVIILKKKATLYNIIKQYISCTSIFNGKNTEDDEKLDKMVKDLEDYVKERNEK